MPFKHLAAFLLLLSFYSCQKKSELPKRIELLPKPQVVIFQNNSFDFNSKTQFFESNNLFENEWKYLKKHCPYLKKAKTKPLQNFITFQLDEKIKNPEGYELEINSNKICIRASKAKGIFYGIQSLLQMMPASVYEFKLPKKFQIQGLKIQDHPKFVWRGMLLDCSRHFMEKDFILRYIDLLAHHKMNTLHWHLVDDQGWRMEIKKYPKLTQIGAFRADVANEMDGEKYCGFYTQEDIREIVAYAKTRHVNVVPEIEMPGHCQSALAAYPEFSCQQKPLEVQTEWGVFKEIYCAGNPETYIFIENILAEVCKLFPSKFIHIGGDEVPKFRWEHCAKCQKTIQENQLKNEEHLQHFFLSKINQILEKQNKKMIGWDEIAEGGLPKNAIVQSWRGMEGAIHALENNHQSIVSPTSHAYFDYDLKSIDLEKVYKFDPIPKMAKNQAEKAQLILGGECNMWSERAPQEKVDSKVFPRILAMSEVLWTYPETRNYEQFYQRTQAHYLRLDAMNVDYGYETKAINFKYFYNNKKSFIELIAGTPDLELKYFWENDSIKTPYENPIEINKTNTLKALAFKQAKPYGEPFELKFNQHKGIGKKYKLDYFFSKHYTAGDTLALGNGLRGTTDFRDGQWQGYSKNDLIAVYDFTNEKVFLSKVSAGFLQYNNSWIFFPKYLKVEISNDGKNYFEIGKTFSKINSKTRGRHLETLSIDFEKQKINYLKITAKNIEKCPQWHEAAGSDAWLFVDEIVLE